MVVKYICEDVDAVIESIFKNMGYIWMYLFLLGSVSSFQENRILTQVGKSVGCAAYILVNWAVIYNAAFVGNYIRVSDVWRWFPAVIFTGIFVICLLIIWKPFNTRILLMATLVSVGIMLLVTVVIILTWKGSAPSPHILKHLSDGSFFAQLTLIMDETWPAHMGSSIYTFVMYLSFRKNQIVSRIGKSALCAVFLFWAWLIPIIETWRLQTPINNWFVSIVCIGIFPVCLYFIWKPLASSLRLKKHNVPCTCCDTAVIYNDITPPHNINIRATCDELIKRCSNGDMYVIRGDCPLEMMVGLLEKETVYTLVQFLHCNKCDKTIFWGLCVRGVPIYKVVKEDEVDKWAWEDKLKYVNEINNDANERKTLLPQHIIELFYNTLSGAMSVDVFEVWLYEDNIEPSMLFNRFLVIFI